MVDWAELDEDLLEALGEDVTYTPSGGSATTVRALFQDPTDPQLGQELQFEATGPRFTVTRTECPNLARGDTFTRNSVGYTVERVPDDEGELRVAECRET